MVRFVHWRLFTPLSRFSIVPRGFCRHSASLASRAIFSFFFSILFLWVWAIDLIILPAKLKLKNVPSLLCKMMLSSRASCGRGNVLGLCRPVLQSPLARGYGIPKGAWCNWGNGWVLLIVGVTCDWWLFIPQHTFCYPCVLVQFYIPCFLNSNLPVISPFDCVPVFKGLWHVVSSRVENPWEHTGETTIANKINQGQSARPSSSFNQLLLLGGRCRLNTTQLNLPGVT